MKIKADLHNHLSTFSNIQKGFNKVLDITKKRLGKNGILGLINAGDDNRYENFINLRGYERRNLGNAIYIPEKKILILRGQELFIKQGHILILGLESNIRTKNEDLEYILKFTKDNNGIVIAVHLFFFEGIGPYLEKNPGLLKYFDGFEVHNGESFYGNKKAKRFYNKIENDYDIGACSFQDGHSLYEIGLSYTWLEKPFFENPDKLNNSLRKSIREHKDFSKDNQHFSILGFLDHSLKYSPKAALLKLGIIKD